MICQNCGKNPATVHLINVINGQKSEMNLCDSCIGDTEDSISQSLVFEMADLIDDFYSNNDYPTKVHENVQCDVCNMSYQEFLGNGKFGCPNCYEQFAEYLSPVLTRLHGATFHDGKVPKRLAKISSDVFNHDKILKLKEVLEQNIKSENYEEAARIRDKIRSVESKGKNQNNQNKRKE